MAENTNVELVGTNDLIHQVTEKVVQDERIKGDSVTITSITTDNENNQIVEFSDGNTMAVPPGKDGDMIAEKAIQEAHEALVKSESVQNQFNQVVIEGDSSVEAAQARVSADGVAKATLKQRLDDEHNEVTAQLAQTAKYVNPTGTNDDTLFLQGIIDNFENVVIKKGTYLIDGLKSITPPANRTITFEKGAVFKCIANDSPLYNVLILKNENIHVINPVVIGDRDEHIGTGGEHGHGIFVGNGNNIIVTNPIVKNCWGDGIYILNRVGKVVIDNPVCENNRRQGISVISAYDLTINSPRCINSNGTPPQAGIDIEPTFAEDVLDFVRINNPYTESNVGAGIVVNLHSIAGTQKVVDIVISNHKDVGSVSGFIVSDNREGINGVVRNISPSYENSKEAGIGLRSCLSLSANIIIDKPIIRNANTNNHSTAIGSAGIVIYRPILDGGNIPLGNITIYEPTIIDDRASKQILRSFYFRDEMEINGEKIKLIDPLFLSSTTNDENKIVMNPAGVEFTDKYNTNVIDMPASRLIRAYFSTITNKGANALTTYTLNFPLVIDSEITFINKYATGLRITPEATCKLTPLSSIIGQSIQTTQVGASIALKKISATEYMITKMIGIWNIV